MSNAPTIHVEHADQMLAQLEPMYGAKMAESLAVAQEGTRKVRQEAGISSQYSQLIEAWMQEVRALTYVQMRRFIGTLARYRHQPHQLLNMERPAALQPLRIMRDWLEDNGLMGDPESFVTDALMFSRLLHPGINVLNDTWERLEMSPHASANGPFHFHVGDVMVYVRPAPMSTSHVMLRHTPNGSYLFESILAPMRPIVVGRRLELHRVLGVQVPEPYPALVVEAPVANGRTAISRAGVLLVRNERDEIFILDRGSRSSIRFPGQFEFPRAIEYNPQAFGADNALGESQFMPLQASPEEGAP